MVTKEFGPGLQAREQRIAKDLEGRCYWEDAVEDVEWLNDSCPK